MASFFPLIWMVLLTSDSSLNMLSNLHNNLCRPQVMDALNAGIYVGDVIYNTGAFIQEKGQSFMYYTDSAAMKLAQPIGKFVEYKGTIVMYMGNGIWFPTTVAKSLVTLMCTNATSVSSH